MKAWCNGAVLLGVVGIVAAQAAHRGASAVVDGAVERDLASLETTAARKPNDVGAALALARGYLDRDEPGLAVAIFQRTPEAVTSSPHASDLAARAYLGAGHATRALALTRETLETCEREGCEASLVARAARREMVLEAMVEMGVEDADTNPEAVELAVRRSVRQVRIAMN